MTLLADACAELDHREAAPIVYDRLLPYADRCATIGAACIFLGSVQYYLGRAGRLADEMGSVGVRRRLAGEISVYVLHAPIL